MRKYAWMIGILIVVLLAATLVGGCGKKQSTSGASVTTAPGTGGAGGGAATLGELLTRQKELTSYVMVMDMGQIKMRTAVKLEGGKYVEMKSDMGPHGWTIMQMDKKMMYTYNPATKSAMAMPMPANMAGPEGPSGPAADSSAALKALADRKTSSETIDGVDCLKVTSADGSNAYWVEKEHGLPVQIKTGTQTIKIKYEQVNSVPDSEFQVPAGVKIQQMPSMPSMPNMPNTPKMPSMPDMPKAPG